MQTPDQEWPHWAAVLQHYHLDQLTAWVLDAGGPFALLTAQALYFFYPFMPSGQIKVLTSMLEEEEEMHAFIRYLRGEHNPDE